MAATKIAVGDTFTVGPIYATKTDGTVVSLAGAKIWVQVKLLDPTTRKPTGLALITKKNAECAGGGDAQVLVTDLATGAIACFITSTDSALLTAESSYRCEARITTATGEVYTVASATWEMYAPVTEIPA